ncbi:Uncharacterized protein dnl_17840 [Desulfonema limicola]|uniref:Uncharacterized protein n=1 Tax=Desulfonema limicola TaxID=45656 RepID=A0A975GFR3_9BACT|nr:hypothetical protein [Desulfonema limicola]QTA79513.1 Uncharacterized protein dnl_17840 [Desulfonema limicola]
MDFKTWCNKNTSPDIEDIDREYISMGWNGAIETVIQVIDQSGCGGDSDEYIKNIIIKLKTTGR